MWPQPACADREGRLPDPSGPNSVPQVLRFDFGVPLPDWGCTGESLRAT